MREKIGLASGMFMMISLPTHSPVVVLIGLIADDRTGLQTTCPAVPQQSVDDGPFFLLH